MANSIVGGLFGADPAVLQAQQRQADMENAAAYAQMTPMQRANASIYQGAAGLGRAAGGLLGLQDPMLAQATELKQIASQFDITTPQGLEQLAQAIAGKYPQQAQQAVAAAQKMKLDQATISQKTGENMNTMISSGKFTPASLSKYRESRDPADLELVDKGLTGGALEKVSSAEQNITSLSSGNTEIDSWLTKVNPEKPSVSFGPTSTVGAGVSNLIGSPTKNALEQGKLRRFVSREANAILTAAKGTQTEGDAQRAYDMIMSGLDKNSNEGVYSALEDLKAMKQNTVKGLETYVGTMKSKGKGTPVSSNQNQNAATGEYADQYALYKAKYKEQALPYNAFAAQYKARKQTQVPQ
jgi:hypothetical protein